MKTILLALVFTTTAALAADLTLKNGTTYKDYQVLSETATTVTIKHKSGGAKIEKKVLPPDLLAQYPIDEAGAAAEAEDNAKGKAVYDAQRKKKKSPQANAAPVATAAEIEDARRAGRKEAELAAAKKAGAKEVTDVERRKAESDAMVEAHNRRAMGEVDSATAAKITAAVRKHADAYFKTQRKQPASALTLELNLDIDHPRSVPSWPNRYTVIGAAWWQQYESSGGFNAEKSWFEATVQIGKGGYVVSEFTPRSTDPRR